MQVLSSDTVQHGTLPEKVEDLLPFGKRFSFRANLVDWVLATPDLGVELDLSGSPKTRFSILINGKYNWNTYHSVQPKLVYNVAAGSIEGRKYWRTGGTVAGPFRRYTKENRDSTISLPLWGFRRLRRNLISGRTFEDPRTWRAYYVGVYAGYEKFTLSLGKKGKQGDSFNFGFSGGWSVPVYPFKNGRSLDLDLGLAVGLKLAAYDTFGYNEEHGCYVYTGTEARHIVPYPVIQDIHVAFVFRFESIGKKVQGGAERYNVWDDKQLSKRTAREEKRRQNWDMRVQDRAVRKKEREQEEHRRDSLAAIHHAADTLAGSKKAKEKAEKAKDKVEKAKDKAEKVKEKAGNGTDKAGKARLKEEKKAEKARKKAGKAARDTEGKDVDASTEEARVLYKEDNDAMTLRYRPITAVRKEDVV